MPIFFLGLPLFFIESIEIIELFDSIDSILIIVFELIKSFVSDVSSSILLFTNFILVESFFAIFFQLDYLLAVDALETGADATVAGVASFAITFSASLALTNLTLITKLETRF